MLLHTQKRTPLQTQIKVLWVTLSLWQQWPCRTHSVIALFFLSLYATHGHNHHSAAVILDLWSGSMSKAPQPSDVWLPQVTVQIFIPFKILRRLLVFPPLLNWMWIAAIFQAFTAANQLMHCVLWMWHERCFFKERGNEDPLLHFNHQMVSSITMQRQMREEGGREVLQMETALSIFINTSNSHPLKTPTEINWGDAWLRQASRLLGQDCRSICWEFIALFVVGGLRGFGCAWNTLWYSLAFNHASSLRKSSLMALGVGLRQYTC